MTPGEPLETVNAAIERLLYGSVVVTLHDGRIVQVDVTERSRFA